MSNKYIAREPEVDVVHTINKNDLTVAEVIYQHTDPELGEVPDIQGYHQKEGFCEVKLHVGDDLSEDQRHMLKALIRRHPDVFTDMPRETNVIQHRVKLTDDRPILCQPYILPYAMTEIASAINNKPSPESIINNAFLPKF